MAIARVEAGLNAGSSHATTYSIEAYRFIESRYNVPIHELLGQTPTKDLKSPKVLHVMQITEGNKRTVHAVNPMKLLMYARFSLALLLATHTATAIVAPQTPLQKIDVSKLGPQVGERVPDFSLKDQNGKTWTLQSIMGPKGAVLVFFRSADW